MTEQDFAVEHRACGDCKHFKRLPTPPPICKKHLMGVTYAMRVTYDVAKGTCFEGLSND